VRNVARRPDRSSPMPLWAQVLEDLRRRLANGEFEAGFPAERELIEQYETSRHTMRDAMRRLHNEGLIERERGRGTFIRRTPIEQRTGALYSLFRSIEDHGYRQHNKVLDLEKRRQSDVASLMSLPASTDFVYLHRLRYADDRPVATDEIWLVAKVAAPLLTVDFEHTAVYIELENRCGVRPGAGWEKVHPALPTTAERSLLNMRARQPAFRVERYTEHAGRALEWRRTIISGELFTFTTAWGDRGEPKGVPSFAPSQRAASTK
jgi:GntR family transcriptional regulator